MKRDTTPRPPRWATRFLSWYCRPSLLEDLEGDLHEYFERNVRTKGVRRARWIYVADVLKFMRIYTLRRPKVLNLFISWIMIGSYLKTTRRTMVRNKLFSFINIFGLSVSMSVGLLVIAIATDLLNYDNFYTHSDRIYCVSTQMYRNGQPDHQMATTSPRAAREIAATVPGIASFTLLRSGFGGEVEVRNALVSIRGLWVDENFLKIFSFEMLEGNPATAFKDPYAIVLTEKAVAKLFGTDPAMGKSVRFGLYEYIVTGVMKDPPHLSQFRFEALGFSHFLERPGAAVESDPSSWENIFDNHAYVLLDEHADVQAVQAGIDKVCSTQSATMKNLRIVLGLEPITRMATNHHLGNSLGPGLPIGVLWVLAGLAFVVIVSACFNYTNLSIARALRRSREVGIRKIVGARKRQVLMQFIMEAVVIAVLALGFSFVMFFLLRRGFLELNQIFGQLVSLELSPRLVGYFVVLALATGILAGVVPALLFSRIQVLQALKDSSGIRLFRAVSMRKSLIVVQYVFSLVFITTTLVAYSQYKSILAFDLGFHTENILNIRFQGKDGTRLADELRKLPMVVDVSRSAMVAGLGTFYGVPVKYKDSEQVFTAQQDFVDDHYVPVHDHELVAGRNFNWLADSATESEILVNEELLKRLDIAHGDPQQALGEELIVEDSTRVTIVGVLKDFYFGSMRYKIEPTVLRYQPRYGYYHVNVRIDTKDLAAAMVAIEGVWHDFDSQHALDAQFYDEQIADNYALLSVMVRVIGFLAFLAICIASLGLLGMVVYTTETKLKEISIRKVLGASEVSLVVFLSRGFVLLLLIAGAIALPITYLFFEQVVLVSFAYHEPISWVDMIAGLAGVLVIASIMIGTQTLKAARTNPATTLKTE